MRHASKVTNAATRLTSVSYHEHWHDVSPMACHQMSYDERKAEAHKYDDNIRKQNERQRRLKANGSRILPALFK